MKTYSFTLVGVGETEEDAWEDALECIQNRAFPGATLIEDDTKPCKCDKSVYALTDECERHP